MSIIERDHNTLTHGENYYKEKIVKLTNLILLYKDL